MYNIGKLIISSTKFFTKVNVIVYEILPKKHVILVILIFIDFFLLVLTFINSIYVFR